MSLADVAIDDATRLGEEARSNIGAIRNVLIDTPAGLRVRLDQVAKISVEGGSLNISRESGMRGSYGSRRRFPARLLFGAIIDPHTAIAPPFFPLP